MSKIEISTIPEIPAQEVQFSDWNTENFKYVYDSDDISYDFFFNEHLLKNLPCVIKNVTKDWVCTRKWLEDNGDINYGYLRKTYGVMEAPVANCNTIEYNVHCKTDMKVSDFVDYMITKPRKELLYLKDWHLMKTLPNNNLYHIHDLFAADWLNEYAIDNNKDDFMFVYIGPQDSWTPLHADVYFSYSWSVNITGRKKWWFFPPGEELKLKDSLKNLPLMYDATKHKEVKYFEVIQEKGEVVFVPSGWHHQVVNLVDTISINHNWVNGCNIGLVWGALNDNLNSVKNEIKEFENTCGYFDDCQKMLRIVFGMNLNEFLDFLLHIAKKRLNILKEENKDEKHLIFNIFEFGNNHIRFDLKILLNMINLFLKHSDVIAGKLELDSAVFTLRQEIKEILQT